jgi:diguanylate cyclase
MGLGEGNSIMIRQHWDDSPARVGVLRQVRGAYWVAIGLVAVLATFSYFLLAGIIESNRSDSRLLDLAGSQQMLSQRIVMLANEAHNTRSEWVRRNAIAQMQRATAEFRDNYTAITGLEPAQDFASGPTYDGPLSDKARALIAAAPYNVAFYTRQLLNAAGKLIQTLPSADDGGAGMVQSQASEIVQSLTGDISEGVLRGYAELAHRFAAEATERIAYTARINSIIFVMMLALLGLEALLIFRPMSALVERKTRALIDAHNDMAHAAAHDALTGLSNRTFLTEHFESMIQKARHRNGRLAVVQIDLDEFKQINDTLGHAAGDFVLKTTAARIDSASRDCDLCARLGGDEFVVVLPSIGDDDDVGVTAARVLAAVNQPIAIDDAVVHVGASAGIAVFPDDAETADDLMVHSDLALYGAKRDGRGSYRYFSESMRARLDERKRLERDLRDAIAGDLFDVHFQPQISLKSAAVTGIEALVRWNHPERGYVPPAAFLPTAEKSGLICEIGRIAIRKAIMQAAQWQRDGIEFGRIGVNVSTTELAHSGFIDFIFATLRAAKLSPDRLSIEVLETVVVNDRESGLIEKLAILRKCGIHVELDDFGTGYATLANINSNAVDRLKIDRQFVSNVHANPKNASIVRAITELARSMGLDIIAEGAETQEELDCLVKLGCFDVQGYSVAFPMPAKELGDWFRTQARRRTFQGDPSRGDRPRDVLKLA